MYAREIIFAPIKKMGTELMIFECVCIDSVLDKIWILHVVGKLSS